MWVLFMLASYGFVFLFHHKIELQFLREKSDHADEFFDCAYCMGFWVGWVMWILAKALGVTLIAECGSLISFFLLGAVWAFASAAFCYIVDEILAWLLVGHL